jgi:hypothetical protein
MEAGISYNKQKLHKAGYFREPIGQQPGHQRIPALAARSVPGDGGAIKQNGRCFDPLPAARPIASGTRRASDEHSAIGPITALTWALEVGEVQRISSIKKAISYCGLCGDEQRSGNSAKRTPISKQRNKHL